ncbi:MAG: hypothetical protein J6K31_12280 [Parabacteroides sp.]|nr:hypothetical protein [Parabacteroides sp.]
MKRMTDDMEFPEELYRDEVVCFIAGRYHVSPHEVIRLFQEQNNICIQTEAKAGEPETRLEDNEIEILRGLACIYKEDNKGGVSKGTVGALHNSPRFQPGGGVSFPPSLYPVRVQQ